MSLTPEEVESLINKLFTPNVLYELVGPTAKLPVQASENSAAYDVFAYLTDEPVDVYPRLANAPTPRLASPEGLVIYPGERAKIPLGIKLHLPHGWQANLLARSGGAWNKGLALANSVGLMDGDYPDQYYALVQNNGSLPLYIKAGEKIVQLNFQRFGQAKFTEGKVVQTTKRAGGLGHSGR